MKKIIINVFAICMAMSFISTTGAQQSNTAFHVKRPSPDEKPHTGTLNNNSFNTSLSSDVNAKAVKNFTKSFKLAENVKWFKIIGGTVAYFTEHGIKNRAGYDNKGNWLYNIRSYPEADLPKDIRARVKSVYYDYAITYVQEITKDQQLIYLVHIKYNKSWKTIRVCEEEDMAPIEEFEEN
ncbi:MAG: hypothetical protein ABIR15_07040 [Chitinophagaceae bacterium]